ncbi:MAG: single-stranded DNA-binding protein [Acidobacteria bacterium]|nr:single-stranded DNA-binding protein [Acidobacteriota bacterium]
MSSLNKVMLIGNLGRDPEIRYTTDGTPVANFSLATSENWTDKNGTRQEHTEWHSIVAWKQLADICKKYLSKGRQVYIEGRIQTREWNDREGNKRRTTEVVATQMVLLGSRTQSTDTGAQPMETATRTTPEQENSFDDIGITDSDIPF